MNVVFVHLGPSSAQHLWANLKYFDREFPRLKKFLILSDPSHLKKLRGVSVEVKVIDESIIDSASLINLEHNNAFRSGFWKYSLQRFYALRYFQDEYSDESLIHFESDILVLPNFPWSAFNDVESLAWPKFNNTSDAASIFYSPSPESLNQLISALEEELKANPKLTDMTALSRLSSAHSIPYIELPTITSSKSEKHMRDFGGVFDAAAIGMWLCGRDPRNHLGWVKRYAPLPEANLQANEYTYTYSNRKLSMQKHTGESFPIFNLHLHSKRKVLFGKFWPVALKIDTLTSQRGWMGNWFVPRAFAALASDYFLRNGFNFTSILKVLSRVRDTNAS